MKTTLDQVVNYTQKHPTITFVVECDRNGSWWPFEATGPITARQIAASESTKVTEDVYIIRNRVMHEAWRNGKRVA